MQPAVYKTSGPLLIFASIAGGYCMIQAHVFEAWKFCLPLLGLWAGWMMSTGSKTAELERLRCTYLLKSLMWAIPALYQPDWSDWSYWQSLIPNAYFCGEADLRNIAVWCAAENWAMTFAIGYLRGRRSCVPFVLAILSALFGTAMRNPFSFATAAYLVGATCPSSVGQLASGESELGTGLSPERPSGG